MDTATLTRSLNEKLDGIGTTITDRYESVTRTLTEQADGVDCTVADAYDTITRTVAERSDALNEQFTQRLVELEARMPELPKKVAAYNRAVADRAFGQARRGNEMVVDAFRPVVRVADHGVRTVVGTTKWAIDQTAQTATTGVKTVVGQAQAQVKRTAGTLGDQTADLVDEATERVVTAERTASRTALRSMTKAELYEIAQDLDIDGRAAMTKAQLVTAITKAR